MTSHPGQAPLNRLFSAAELDSLYWLGDEIQQRVLILNVRCSFNG